MNDTITMNILAVILVLIIFGVVRHNRGLGWG